MPETPRPRIYVVGSHVTKPITAADLARIERDLQALRVILDDPIALLARAEALLTGTAERLI